MALKHRAKVLCVVSRHKKCVMYLVGKVHLLDICVSDGTVGLNPVLMSQHCLISGVPLNRSMHMAGFFTDGCHRIHLTKAWRNVAGISPKEQWSSIHQVRSGMALQSMTSSDDENSPYKVMKERSKFSVFESTSAEIVGKDHRRLVCVFTQLRYHTGG